MNPFRILDPDHMARGLCALAVMTKVPQAGRVKTRLVPPLTSEEAAELNKCFLRDTAVAISSACCRRSARPPSRSFDAAGSEAAKAQCCGIAVYTPVGAESAYSDILPADFSLLPQRGDKFGERLYFAVKDLFKCGFDSVCLIDSDSPTVPAANFEQAVELLALPGDRIVLGPSDDGGYYLIGLKKPHRQVFENIDWSTERVLDQTMQRATENGLEVRLLPAGYDVDDGASLRRLSNELLGEQGDDGAAPNTRRFLADLVGQKKLWGRRSSRRAPKGKME